MKPHLVIGLGNELMGDDGVARHILEQLAADARRPEDIELFCLLAIAISSARIGPGLSPQLAAKLPEVLERVAADISGGARTG